MASAENLRQDLCTTKFPFWNSLATSGWRCSRVIISLRWIGSHHCVVEVVVGGEVWDHYREKSASLNDRISASIVSSTARMRLLRPSWKWRPSWITYWVLDNLINYGCVAKTTTHFGPHITVLSLVTCQSVVANFKMAAILDFHIWPTNINFW